MRRLFACLLVAAAFPAYAQTSWLATITPANPTSDDELVLHTYTRACWHSSNSTIPKVPERVRIQYTPGTVTIDIELYVPVCFAAGDPVLNFPYAVPLGRLAAGTYAVQVNQKGGPEPMQTLVVAAGAKPTLGALPDAMTVAPAIVESGETVTVGLPLRECTTASGRERVWTPNAGAIQYPIAIWQPVSGCAGAGTANSIFLLPYLFEPFRIGEFSFRFERHTYLGATAYSDPGPTSVFDATVDVRGFAPMLVQHGMWWNAPAGSESGWGINLMQQGNTIFASWFTFDLDGSPLWLVMSATKTTTNTYTGTLYRGTGPAFSAVPFDPAMVSSTAVGTGTLTFVDGENATFGYTIKSPSPIGSGLPAGTISGTKSITRQVFGTTVPVCIWGPPTPLEQATNYTDMWWNAPSGSESGWGIALTHQGDTIFASWFTFAANGKPLWLVTAAKQVAPGRYSGRLFTGTGPAFDAPKFDSAKVVALDVGTATFTFADGDTADFAYVVNGIAQTKRLTRQVFTPPGTVCH